MGKPATKNGADWQVYLWDLFRDNPGFRKDHFQANISFDDLVDIDSKISNNDSNKNLKKKLANNFLETHDKMAGIRDASALRGDILCETLNIIIDIKNYGSVQGTMKLKDLNLNDYIKGIDSNLKYPLFYAMDGFDYVDNYGDIIKSLRDFYFSKDKSISWFRENIQSKFSENKTIAYMTPADFAEFFCFNECGYAWKLAGVKPMKGFSSKIDDTVEFKVVDFKNNIKSSFVEVKLHVDDDGYVYINFYDGDTCIYIISQRGWTGKMSKRFVSNCSFINKKYMTLVSKVELPKTEK